MTEGLGKSVILGEEDRANHIVAIICAALSVFILVYFLMVRLNVVTGVNHSWFYSFSLLTSVLLMLSVIAYYITGGKGWWVKYLTLGSVMVISLFISVSMDDNYIIFALPLALCILYYNRRFAILMAVICGALILSEPFVAYLAENVNLNFVTLTGTDDGTVTILDWGMTSITEQLTINTVPCFVLFMSVAVLSILLTEVGYRNMVKNNEIAVHDAAVVKELSIAAGIQKGMLPEDIPDNGDFSISAEMMPAKTVGGDFYDFLKVDDTHVALVIADVSGKGIPASLFMAGAKSALRSNLANGLQPDMVMKKTNKILCDSNREKLFVTAWLGVIDLEDGRMSYVNAGHNPPYIIRDGNLEKLSEQPNFVLGGKKRVDYKENRTTLQPGDVLFLYTDGVTEAVGPGGTMFGNPRLEDVLVKAGKSSGDVLRAVDESVREFVAGKDRYDDMTMVVFGLNRYMREDLVFKDFMLDHGSYNDVMSHIRAELASFGCPENVIRDIEICSSEILANIDMYAYQEKGGELGVAIRVAERKAKVVFRDKGPEYNPLLKDNPDIEKRIKDHKVGGFGLFIVRKMMDEVTYAREEGYNVLTIKRGY